jgi:hypothetical protein
LSESGFPTFTADGGVISNPDLTAIDLISRVMIALSTKMISALSSLAIDNCKAFRVERMDPAVGGGEVLGGSAGVSLRLSYTRMI